MGSKSGHRVPGFPVPIVLFLPLLTFCSRVGEAGREAKRGKEKAEAIGQATPAGFGVVQI